ncbi:NAD(P)/FAD-dependent oxidoreductase [Saccharothrix obliqua]|uniref:NAD(P)/FAD-dependent oxidoreductase n=1 Tax=Saccharothrix obliqua TaxID=2861747 RepID=UPI001C5F6DEA|nr:FAD-dependent oxidoreductase [Saccharothrix obliqua]MBW4721404.1 FAD-dependent oxidoreductase [Saccharothrix obliqua]
MTDVLVVGASAAGLATAEALRRRGFTGSIRLLGAEEHPPYDRPPLSKEVLAGTRDPERVVLRGADDLAALDIELVTGRGATALDVVRREVSDTAGRRHAYGSLVIATGLTPRRLGRFAGPAGVHVLRTVEDTRRLHADLLTARRLVVLGGGVLGCEIAATARQRGLDVTLVDRGPAPMARQAGPRLGALLADLHRAHGVKVLTDVTVEDPVVHEARVTGVRTSAGRIAADAVVVAVGATPATGWLRGSGLVLSDGVVCDSRCRAAEGVYAVGDVARWWHEGQGRSVRLENRTNATEQALAVADNIMGADRPYVPVPYFWTDQYDVRMQVFGDLAGADALRVLEGDPATRKFVAAAESGGRVIGVVGWNSARAVRRARGLIADRGVVDA